MLKENQDSTMSSVWLCVFYFSFIALILILSEEAVFASPTTGGEGAMPWESALTKIQASINGPVAIAVSLVAIAAAGVSLYFGGDLQGFMRTACYLALAIGVVVMSSNILQGLYAKSAHIVLLN